MATSNPSSSKQQLDTQSEPPLLPQYGFGSTYTFDALVEHHHFLFRVHTPHHGSHAGISRPSSPGRPSTPYSRPPLSRSPSSLSTSFASIRSFDSAPANEDEEDSTSADPYFLSRRFKDELSSPDWGQRRRTLSTLSSISGHTYIGSDYGDTEGVDSEGETAVSSVGWGLSRSTSMTLAPTISRIRRDGDSFRPGHRRSHSVDYLPSPPRPASRASQAQPGRPQTPTEGANMTYEDLVRHLDWTTRASSPYVTTSFSFFWCLWEAVRRYRLGMKHGVEIAVIDASKVIGRAKTALEVLRGVEGERQDRNYWKWYRFALESQDVLVFGAIPGDAIYASVPLTQILPKLPAYFFKDDASSVPGPLADAHGVNEGEDPRSPTSRSPAEDHVAPLTDSTYSQPHLRHDKPFSPQLLSALAWDVGTSLKPLRHQKASSLSSTQSSPSKPKTHTTHKDFCITLTGAFISPGRSHASRLLDATTGAVRLAETLVEPWFRAQCAVVARYPFRHGDDSDSEDEMDGDKKNEKECLGVAGDGCELEHPHEHERSAGVHSIDAYADEAQREAASVLAELALSISRWPAAWWYAEHAGEVDGVVWEVVRMCVEEAGRGVGERVGRGVERERRRVASSASLSGSVRNLRQNSKNEDERRGREENRELKPAARSPGSKSSILKSPVPRRPQDGLPMPWPSRGTPSGTPNIPRARSPLGLGPALGPAIVLQPKDSLMIAKEHRQKGEWDDSDSEKASLNSERKDAESIGARLSRPVTPHTSPALRSSASTPATPPAPASTRSQSATSTPDRGHDYFQASGSHISWSPALATPPPTPPRSKLSSIQATLNSPLAGRRSPPPPPPPRSKKRLSLTSLSSPASQIPQQPVSDASAIKPVLDRADSVPGEWPGDSDNEKESAVVQGPSGTETDAASTSDKKSDDDVFRRARPRQRVMSWAGATLTSLGAFGLSMAFDSKKKKSNEDSQVRSFGLGRKRTVSQGSASSRSSRREKLVKQVVSSIFDANSGKSDRTLEVPADQTSHPVQDAQAQAQLQLQPHSDAVKLERRTSDHSIGRERKSELSPVREVAQEMEAQAEADSLKDVEGAQPEPLAPVDLTPSEEARASLDKLTDTVNSSESGDMQIAPPTVPSSPVKAPSDPAEPAQTQETVRPQSISALPPAMAHDRRRSSTLESIPEEEREAWSVIDPLSAVERANGSSSWIVEPGVESVAEHVNVPSHPDRARLENDEVEPGLRPEEIALPPSPALSRSPSPTPVAAPPQSLKRDASVMTDDGDMQDAIMEMLKPERSIFESRNRLSALEEDDASIDSEPPSEELSRVQQENNKLFTALLPLSQSGNSTKSAPKHLEKSQAAEKPRTTLRLPSFLSSRSPISPVFEDDDPYSLARTSSWAVSCFVCGVIVTVFLISAQRREIMIGNRYC